MEIEDELKTRLEHVQSEPEKLEKNEQKNLIGFCTRSFTNSINKLSLKTEAKRFKWSCIFPMLCLCYIYIFLPI